MTNPFQPWTELADTLAATNARVKSERDELLAVCRSAYVASGLDLRVDDISDDDVITVPMTGRVFKALYDAIAKAERSA